MEAKNSQRPAGLVRPVGLGTACCHPGPPWTCHMPILVPEPVTHMSDSHCRDVIACTNCISTEKRESLPSGASRKNSAREAGNGSHKPEKGREGAFYSIKRWLFFHRLIFILTTKIRLDGLFIRNLFKYKGLFELLFKSQGHFLWCSIYK